jgi:hypothetical protein
MTYSEISIKFTDNYYISPETFAKIKKEINKILKKDKTIDQTKVDEVYMGRYKAEDELSYISDDD